MKCPLKGPQNDEFGEAKFAALTDEYLKDINLIKYINMINQEAPRPPF